MCNITLKYLQGDSFKDYKTVDQAYTILFENLNCFVSQLKDEKIDLPDQLHFSWINLEDLFKNDLLKNCIEIKIDKIYPTIYIGSQDINDNTWKKVSNHFVKIYQLDHSICQFYIQYTQKEVFIKNLKLIIEKIKIFNELELYETLVCYEYQDLYARTVGENVLKGGHGEKILPFLFTGKTHFQNLINELLNNENNIFRIVNKIKILLIDDHAQENLRALNDKENIKKNKEQILNSLFQYFIPNQMIKFVIDIVDNVEFIDNDTEADQQADLVLLDYNFNNEKSGVNFIKALHGDYKTIKLRGFGNKIHVIPISSFSRTFRDDLRFQGLPINFSSYTVHNGADFLSTPEVFIYYLLSLTVNLTNDFVGWSIDWEETEKTIKEVCYAAFNLSHGQLENKRKEWINKFSDVSAIFSKITQIELDAEDVVADDGEKISGSHSFLAESLQTYLKDPTNRSKIRVLTHYRDLLYQLAFKSYQDNEYIFIEANKLKEALKN
jgi:hypothetical protein